MDGIQLITKLKSNMKGALMSVSDKLLLRKRAIIETENDELKNIAQVEYSRHRSFDNFVVNLLGGIAAYCYFPKKPSIRVQTVDMSNDSLNICIKGSKRPVRHKGCFFVFFNTYNRSAFRHTLHLFM